MNLSLHNITNSLFSVRNLKLVFIFILVLRFLFPFYFNPMESLFSDPQRHWDNGLRLLTPTLFNAIDPKFYQLYIHFIQMISGEGNGNYNWSVIALCTGLLCSSFAYLWLLFAREILPVRHAYILAIIIALYPSFWGVYAFFMNETLFLNMLGLSMWLTFRALRKDQLRYSIYAVISLLLLLHTRLTGLPIFLCFSGILFLKQSQKIRYSLISGLIVLAISVPAGVYTFKVINVFSPFYFSKMNKIYYLCDYRSFGFQTNRLGAYIFGSPSYYTEMTEPFYHYNPPRSAGVHRFTINLDKGSEDWDVEIARLNALMTPQKIVDRKLENLVFLLFGPEWPESSKDVNAQFYKRLCFYSRWIWAPLILFVLLSAPLTKYEHKEYYYITYITYAMLILLILQSSGVLEGRYRTAIEPLILTTVYLFIFRKRCVKNNEGELDGQAS